MFLYAYTQQDWPQNYSKFDEPFAKGFQQRSVGGVSFNTMPGRPKIAPLENKNSRNEH